MYKRTTIKEIPEEVALSKAAALCSAGEHCVSDIEEKLAKWGQSPEAQARIIAHLIEGKYIDEQRFARAFALDKMRYNHWGRIKIDMQMRMLGISATDRAYGLGEIPEDEYLEMVRDVVAQKLRSTHANSDFELNGKVIRFAMQRGIETSLVMKMLHGEIPDVTF